MFRTRLCKADKKPQEHQIRKWYMSASYHGQACIARKNTRRAVEELQGISAS